MNSLSSATAASAAILTITLLGCASSGKVPSIDFEDNYRFAGSLSGVRMDAQLLGDASSWPLHLVYEVENARDGDIIVATGSAVMSYDERQRTLTVSLGAEVPAGDEVQVERISPGERKRFTVSASPEVGVPIAPRMRQAARFVKVRLTYLREAGGFALQRSEGSKLVVRVSDATLPRWLEQNESFTTNALPLDWSMTMTPVNPAYRAADAAGRRFR